MVYATTNWLIYYNGHTITKKLMKTKLHCTNLLNTVAKQGTILFTSKSVGALIVNQCKWINKYLKH